MRPAAALALFVLATPLPGAPPAVAASLAAGGNAPFRIVPGPRVKKAVPAEGRTAPSRYTLRGLTVEVEFLEPEARARFIRTLDPAAGDPFASPPGRPETYHAVRLTFENVSAADVTFQPGNVLLITDPGEQQRPLDLTDLYRIAAGAAAGDPEGAMERAARLIYDSSTTIPRGRTASRLVVFGPLPRKWKEIRLLFSFLQIGVETHTLSFTFHKQVLAGRG
jgi:hypothetical protein